MRILVFGNINSGKSYLISKLSKIFNKYFIYKIDDYRMQFGDGTWECEEKSQNRFIQDISHDKNCFVECTGLGPLGEKLLIHIDGKVDVIIHVNTPVEVCLNRLVQKDFTKIPYPKVLETLEETIKRSQNVFDSGQLHSMWQSKVLKIIPLMDDVQKISTLIKQYQKFSDIVFMLNSDNEVKTILPIGSFARNEMNEFSDIDCFISSSEKVEYFIKKFNKLNTVLIDHIKNKITIRYHDDMLIELFIVKSLSEGERYIKGSLIANPFENIIKASKEDLEYLKKLKLNNHLPIDNMKHLYSEMIYFVLSLPKIIAKNNRYKYYFHFNIVLHNYIRICEILRGHIEYNYLPLVSYDEYKHMLLNEEDDLKNHYQLILNQVKRLINHSGEYYKDKYLVVLENIHIY